MLLTAEQPHALAAIRVDLCAIFVSIELSKSTRLISALAGREREDVTTHRYRR